MSAKPNDYLIIEQFLNDALQARALEAAFDLGVIDRLADKQCCDITELLSGCECDAAGGHFLLQMLVKSGVVINEGEVVRLSKNFREALLFRDLLTTKLCFARLVAADYFERMPQLLQSAESFMATANLFRLFDYGHCLEVTIGNCMQASRWMQLTTMLTRYEAPVCSAHYDFGPHQCMLDIGGNSGEFVLQICRHQPELRALVLDLPVVCQVGQRHVSSQPEAARIQFLPGDMVNEPFPDDADLISWKSVLHDWPDDVVLRLLQKSFVALPEGGKLLIFERQSWDFSLQPTGYGLLPVLLFFRSYRSPETYVQWLQQCGFADVDLQKIQLEVPFSLITGVKPVSSNRHCDIA
jgi:hypothetical protein